MPTPIPTIAASCGAQSTTSSRRVPTHGDQREAHDHREQGVEQRQPHRDDAERQEQHQGRHEDAEDLPGAALLGRRPVDDVPAERHLDPALAIERERVLGHRLDLRGIDVAGALAELDLGERDPAVLGHGRAACERIADGEHLGRLLDLRANPLDLRAVAGVQDATLVDREDDAGGVARLLREALLEQVIGPLRLRPRKAEVVHEVAGGGAPQRGAQDEGGDPQADHGAASIVAPGSELAHRPETTDAVSVLRSGYPYLRTRGDPTVNASVDEGALCSDLVNKRSWVLAAAVARRDALADFEARRVVEVGARAAAARRRSEHAVGPIGVG